MNKYYILNLDPQATHEWDRRMTTIRELKGHIDLKPLDGNSFRCNI